MTLFPNKVTVWSTRDKTSTYGFGKRKMAIQLVKDKAGSHVQVGLVLKSMVLTTSQRKRKCGWVSAEREKGTVKLVSVAGTLAEVHPLELQMAEQSK
jgi:hypothetical protein